MIDLTKDRAKLKELYKPPTTEFVLVDVPNLPFAIIDGQGSPDNGAAAKAIESLLAAIAPIRKQAKAKMGRSFVEPPVEMLYWADDMADLAAGKKDRWKWRVMISLPAWIDELAFDAAKPSGSPARMDCFEEGLCVQIMHKGSLEEVPVLLERLYTEFLPQQNLVPAGAYHEIYLNDWSKAAPKEKRLILRQPVSRS